jgi:citrate synthase
MGMLVATVAAMSTIYRDAKDVTDPESREANTIRLIAKMPTVAAFTYRHNRGLPYVYPDNDLTYIGNFLSMLWKMAEPRYAPNPILERAIDVLFILHADHEQNCSANAMRSVGSSESDPYSSTAAAAAALYGPLHGGANEAVINMLNRIGDKKNIPDFVRRVKEGEGLLWGFGHRVYKTTIREPKLSSRRPTKYSSLPVRIPSSRSLSNLSASRSKMITSSSESSTPTSTSTPESSIRRLASPSTCSRRYLRFPVPQVGWHNGGRC